MQKWLIAFILLPSVFFGVETKFISENNFQSIWLWQLSNTSINYEQGISLPNNATSSYKTDKVLWSVETVNNKLMLGTADTAEILSLSPTFEEKIIYKNPEKSIVTSIQQFDKGFLATVSPGATLVHFNAGNSVLTNIEVTNNYFWNIVPATPTKSYLLAGQPAEVYEYSGEKLSSLGTIANEEHLIKGIYIKNTLWILGEHALYKQQGTKFIAIASFDGTASDFTTTNDTFYITVSSIAKNEESKKETVSGSLISVTENGLVNQLFSIKGFYFTGLGVHEKSIIMGSDQFGFYVKYDLITKKTEFASLGEGKIIKIYNENNRLKFITSDTSGIWTVSKQQAVEGSFISEVYDTGNISEWGVFDAQTSTPPKTGVFFYIQSGATADPAYWTDWQPVNIGQHVPAPKARYIRYKAVLKSENGTVKPYVHAVKFPYREINLAPVISHVTIERDNNQILMSWNASDPNQDILEYDIYLAEDGLANIKINKDPITETNFSFANGQYPSGYKRIVLAANDKPSNTENSFLTTSYNTIPVLFDGDSPIIENIVITGRTVTFRVSDATSPIRNVTLIINGEEYVISLQPEDGLFDNKTETFRYTLPSSKKLFVSIIAEDSAGNTNAKGVSLP